MPDLFYLVKEAAIKIDRIKTRTPYGVLAATQSELGELAVEIAILEGDSYKKPDADGPVGEAVDTILALLDLIHVIDPTITSDQVNEIAKVKLAKWESKVKEHYCK